MDKKQEVNFYKIEDTSFLKIFPKLIEAIVAKNNKVMILTKDQEQTKLIDELLWLYSQLSFLPHATFQDELKVYAPVYITTDKYDNANNANIIAILQEDYKLNSENMFEKYLLFYNKDSVERIKEKVTSINENQFSCCFIAQDKKGAWLKSNEVIS